MTGKKKVGDTVYFTLGGDGVNYLASARVAEVGQEYDVGEGRVRRTLYVKVKHHRVRLWEDEIG